MSFPKTEQLGMPIMHELIATGGTEDVRFLYEKLINYFPQITEEEIYQIRNHNHAGWRKVVQKAGLELEESGFIKRVKGIWQVSPKGREQVESEIEEFDFSTPEETELNHTEVQNKIIEIGNALGFFAQKEFEYYDVVWRETAKAARLSHVFEVQSKGNLDSALTKLKRAYTTQRSKIFLILTHKRDDNRARRALEQEFQELENHLVIITFSQIKLISQNLRNIGEFLREFLLK